jgi:hypothetical protein
LTNLQTEHAVSWIRKKQGDCQVYRATNLEGRKFKTDRRIDFDGIYFHQFKDGKPAERSGKRDMLNPMHRLDLIPQLEGPIGYIGQEK